eukprot:4001528-Amphidinium_carterae.1
MMNPPTQCLVPPQPSLVGSLAGRAKLQISTMSHASTAQCLQKVREWLRLNRRCASNCAKSRSRSLGEGCGKEETAHG